MEQITIFFYGKYFFEYKNIIFNIVPAYKYIYTHNSFIPKKI